VGQRAVQDRLSAGLAIRRRDAFRVGMLRLYGNFSVNTGGNTGLHNI
jgi:hypothetical protein